MQVCNVVVSATWFIGKVGRRWLKDFCYCFLSSCFGCAVLDCAAGVANRTSLLLIKPRCGCVFDLTNPTWGWYQLTVSLQSWAWPMQRPWVKRAVGKTWKLNRESKGKPGFSEHQDSLMAIELLLLLLLIKGRNLILPTCAFCSDSRCNKPNGSATLVWPWPLDVMGLHEQGHPCFSPADQSLGGHERTLFHGAESSGKSNKKTVVNVLEHKTAKQALGRPVIAVL